MKLAIVILNWNGCSFLKQFLPDLIKNNPSYSEIIIADNNSNDDSIDFLHTHYPQLKIIQNTENGGFAKGYNDALKQINAEYYCLLNSDIEVSENWIQPIIDLMDKDTSVGICQPKILSYHHRNQFEYAGACGGYIDSLAYPFCRGRIFEHLEYDTGQYDNPVEIFWATGACMFVRSKLYHQLNGLDEDFFAHQEEIDFCWRTHNTGYKIMVCPQSKIYHIGGGTLPKNNARKTYLNFRNNLYLILKNAPKKRLFKILFCKFFLDFLAAFVFLLQRKPQDFKAIFKAYHDFYKNYTHIKSKRPQTIIENIPQIYRHSIVRKNYIDKIHRFSDLNIN